ncbi:DUF6098 family protein [Streptomyces sp. Inha503]|uniref:DUF6098 family protein n=1 Tax=Streptomyces sp. Inha503 TaxID=3383314 RepID=UPI0039A0D0A6
MPGTTLPTYTALHQLVELIEQGPPVFVRWSRGPEADLEGSAISRDGLTGTKMPGLSANFLVFEEWAKDLPTTVARGALAQAVPVRPWRKRRRGMSGGSPATPWVAAQAARTRDHRPGAGT